MQNSTEHIPQLLDKIYRKDSRRIFATLIRLLGDFDLAEDAMHDAFKAVLEQWKEKGIPSNRIGPYTLQAAIAAVHAEAKSSAGTDWAQIVGLYSLLLHINPSPVIELNRAVAVAMSDGSEAGLKQIDVILDRGELTDYHLAHSARAELCRRLGRTNEAQASWKRALALAQQDPERRFIERKLRELGT